VVSNQVTGRIKEFEWESKIMEYSSRKLTWTVTFPMASGAGTQTFVESAVTPHEALAMALRSSSNPDALQHRRNADLRLDAPRSIKLHDAWGDLPTWGLKSGSVIAMP
jgi:hypothetical protein